MATLLAGVPGLEPGMSEPKPDALPLGYTPIIGAMLAVQRLQVNCEFPQNFVKKKGRGHFLTRLREGGRPAASRHPGHRSLTEARIELASLHLWRGPGVGTSPMTAAFPLSYPVNFSFW